MEDVLHRGWRGPGRGRVQLVHLCSASGAGGRRGDGRAPCGNPRQHPAFIRALRGVPASGSPLPFPKFRVLGADFTRHPEPA